MTSDSATAKPYLHCAAPAPSDRETQAPAARTTGGQEEGALMGHTRSEELTAWREAYADDADDVRVPPPTRVPEVVEVLEFRAAIAALTPDRLAELTAAERTVDRVRRVLHEAPDLDLRRLLLEAIEHE